MADTHHNRGLVEQLQHQVASLRRHEREMTIAVYKTQEQLQRALEQLKRLREVMPTAQSEAELDVSRAIALERALKTTTRNDLLSEIRQFIMYRLYDIDEEQRVEVAADASVVVRELMAAPDGLRDMFEKAAIVRETARHVVARSSTSLPEDVEPRAGFLRYLLRRRQRWMALGAASIGVVGMIGSVVWILVSRQSAVMIPPPPAHSNT